MLHRHFTVVIMLRYVIKICNCQCGVLTEGSDGDVGMTCCPILWTVAVRIVSGASEIVNSDSTGRVCTSIRGHASVQLSPVVFRWTRMSTSRRRRTTERCVLWNTTCWGTDHHRLISAFFVYIKHCTSVHVFMYLLVHVFSNCNNQSHWFFLRDHENNNDKNNRNDS